MKLSGSLLVALLALGVLSLPSTARAAELKREGSFAITLPDRDVCIVFPASLRKPADCAKMPASWPSPRSSEALVGHVYRRGAAGILSLQISQRTVAGTETIDEVAASSVLQSVTSELDTIGPLESFHGGALRSGITGAPSETKLAHVKVGDAGVRVYGYDVLFASDGDYVLTWTASAADEDALADFRTSLLPAIVVTHPSTIVEPPKKTASAPTVTAAPPRARTTKTQSSTDDAPSKSRSADQLFADIVKAVGGSGASIAFLIYYLTKNRGASAVGAPTYAGTGTKPPWLEGTRAEWSPTMSEQPPYPLDGIPR